MNSFRSRKKFKYIIKKKEERIKYIGDYYKRYNDI